MNLYKVSIRRKYVRGLQPMEESFLIISDDPQKAKTAVNKKLKAPQNGIIITGAVKIQDAEYLLGETFLIAN